MSSRTATWSLTAVLTASMMAALVACGGERGGAAQERADVAVTVTPENLVVVDSGRIESGPSISGSLQPERQADIRAEVAGSVLETRAEEGERVARGALLARIDDTAVRDQFLSARSALRSAEQAAALAQRNLERARRLAEAGAISERDLETARLDSSTAESQRADAAARFALAQKQLASTRVTAPFAGVVSDRAVSAGDVVQPGAALYTVVDPSSMELRAAVPASELGAVRVDAPVEFTVNGYPGRVFTGRVTRINPTANAATGQVEITAALPNTGGALVGGLFAEGRISSQSRETLVVPLDAVEFSGSESTVLRVKQGKAERTVVQIGIRDEQGEQVELVSGIALGDTLLLGAVKSITPGTPVRVQEFADRPVSAQR
jgi:membrane fusion protein (multidrug efflux system)